MSAEPNPYQQLIEDAVQKIGKQTLIAAKVAQHGENIRAARLDYEQLAGEHFDKLKQQGLVGLPNREEFSRQVGRKLLNMHAGVNLEKRMREARGL